MRKIFIVFLFMLSTGAYFSADAQSNKSLAGDWEYNVPQAPLGYDTGTVSFIVKENTLSAVVTFHSGYKAEAQNVSLKNDTLRMGVYVESEYVNVLTIVKGNKMEGTVDSSQGKMNFKAEKVASAVKK